VLFIRSEQEPIKTRFTDRKSLGTGGRSVSGARHERSLFEVPRGPTTSRPVGVWSVSKYWDQALEQWRRRRCVGRALDTKNTAKNGRSDYQGRTHRVVRGSILCYPIQPNPLANWPNPTHYKWKNLDQTPPKPILTVIGYHFITLSDRFPVAVRSAIKSNLTAWCNQILSNRVLNALNALT